MSGILVTHPDKRELRTDKLLGGCSEVYREGTGLHKFTFNFVVFIGCIERTYWFLKTF